VSAPEPDPLAVGTHAVRLARGALAEALGVGERAPLPSPEDGPLAEFFRQPRGVFVTLRRFPGAQLRGCIGFPRPVYPLERAVREAAVSAGLEDPRFRPTRADELAHITLEVSILTIPEVVRPPAGGSLADAVQVGRDGLIVEGFGTSGLLLPQVAPEQGWDAAELLDGTCEKAGLPPGTWRDPRVRVRRFEARIFAEETPGGTVVAADPPLTPRAGRPSRRT
jgi:uncharacterized protein